MTACLKIPERGCVVLDQPQQVASSRRMGRLTPLCGWSSTQPRSYFRHALSNAVLLMFPGQGWLGLGMGLAALVAGLAAPAAIPPGDVWRTAAPETQGFSSAKLTALQADLAARGTKALLVIRHDAIVCEWYAPDHAAGKPHYTASLAKAIVGGLSLAVALNDGRLALDDPASRFLPQWRDDPRKSRITLRQLGSHTAGIEDAEAEGKAHEELTVWKGDFWKRLPVPNDPFTVARDHAPLVFEPGQRMQYSNPGMALMTYCVTAALRDAPQHDLRSLLREQIMRPIGVPDAEWSAGYGQTFTVDELPLVASWGGGGYTARATARIGRLLLRNGDWDGQRILSPEAVRLTTSDAGTPGPCGIGWWSNQEGDCVALPRDAFFGSGAGHQILLVVPSLGLVLVRFGGVLATVSTDPASYHEPYCRHFFEPLMAALTSTPAEAPPRPAGEVRAAVPSREADTSPGGQADSKTASSVSNAVPASRLGGPSPRRHGGCELSANVLEPRP